MKKEIVFFDGDGTLWYPKSTKWKMKPHWIYKEHPKFEKYIPHLKATPSIIATLKKLKSHGKTLIALSTHPHPRLEADIHMNAKMEYLKLNKLFDAIYTARPYPWGKGKVMVSVLKKLDIPKSRAILIGDSYIYDYVSAKVVGIECMLLNTPYLEIPDSKASRIKVLNKISDLPNQLLDI
jgi:FMN phosphatase YigB (HAD superfamily)